MRKGHERGVSEFKIEVESKAPRSGNKLDFGTGINVRPKHSAIKSIAYI